MFPNRFGEVLSRSLHNRMAPVHPPGKILSPWPALYRVVHVLNHLVEAVDLKTALEASICQNKNAHCVPHKGLKGFLSVRWLRPPESLTICSKIVDPVARYWVKEIAKLPNVGLIPVP